MLLDVFEIRTDSGGAPAAVKAGRIWQEGAGIRLLERWSPNGLLIPSEDNPWIFASPASQEQPQLDALSPLRAAIFDYRRTDSPSWERLEISGDQAAFNGAALSGPELRRILQNIRQGIAEVRYSSAVPENRPLHESCNKPKPGTDPTVDSELGLPNLLAFETATYPIAAFSLRSYDRLWRDDPRTAVDLARSLSSAAKAVGGHWYHLWCGQFAREIGSPEEAVSIVGELNRAMAGTAAGEAGMADILALAPVDSGCPDASALAAMCPSGSACLIGDRLVAL